MTTSQPIGRQIVLPFSKAIEIAYKNIRLRLSRSLLVISGIVLALAFLMSVLTSDALIAAMRNWSSAGTDVAHQQLQVLMKSNGVPTSASEIASSRIQTRWLTGLALLVAFVGILNAMLMSVTERFREIGTMKCLGALDSFIVKLFLLESLFQGIVGTIMGIALGLLASLGAAWCHYGKFAWVDVPVTRIAQAAGVCLLVGIALTVAGAVYPAWQAARMQPIDAMRVET
jgi:putative ABC transport system permease protein